MSYLVLARKWRPQSFDDVVGQQVATRALSNALVSGRIHHAYLFTGARGVGKTTAARILAKALNCEKGPTATPCNTCSLCEEVTQGRSVDVLEIDGASNTGVDDVRDLREKVKYLPARARYKVLIIDEVHMLSGSAFNALLKTLEEPPAHVVFVFATTEPHKIPATVLSRVQRYDFRRIAHTQVVGRLASICAAEGVHADTAALSLIAREAEGSMRDALSLLDQAWSASLEGQLSEAGVAEALGVVDRTTLLGISKALLHHDAVACLRHVETVFERGHDMRQFTSALMNLLRDLAVTKVSGDKSNLDRPDAELEEMRVIVQPHEGATLYRLFDGLAKAFEELARSTYPKLLLEMTLLRLAAAEPLRPLAEAISKLEALERRLSGGRIEGPRVSAPLVATRTSEDRPPAAVAATPVAATPVAATPVAATPVAATPVAATPVAATPVAATPVAATPVAATPVAAASFDPVEAWGRVVEKVRARKRSLSALLEQAELLAFDAGSLQLGFAEPFLVESVSAKEPSEVLLGLAREVGGPAVRLLVELLAPGAKGLAKTLAQTRQETTAADRDRARKAIVEHPNVLAAQEVLGAKVLEVRLKGAT